MLGTTFGGNHLACTAAITVLDIMEHENLVENSRVIGDYLINALRSMPCSGLKEVRGRGLMIGIDFDEPIKDTRMRLLFEQKVFTGVAGAHTIRLLPPLCLTQLEADDFLARFKKVT
jgi:acetylornithine aminotransferase